MMDRSISAAIDSDGFVVLPGVMTDAEVEQLRAQAHAALDRFGIASNSGSVIVDVAGKAPGLLWCSTIPAVLEAVKEGFGDDNFFLVHEAILHRNYMSRVWHKDIGDYMLEGGYFGCDPIGRPDCKILKVAFYLQDHPDGSGLRVRPGTHHERDLAVGDEVCVPTRAGDAVMFDLRITHRGTPASASDLVAKMLCRLVPSRSRQRAIDRTRRLVRRISRRPDRIVLFLSYGQPTEATARFDKATSAVSEAGARI